MYDVLYRKSWATPSGRAIRFNSRSLALPGIYSSIPVASVRWRSLRAPLAKEKGEGTHECSPRRVVALCHTCSRQQPCGSSAALRPGQEALGRAVKVADREDRLRVITNHLAWGTANAIFRTKIGDFPHQLPPKSLLRSQVLTLCACDPTRHHDGAFRLGG